jgi:hypothetical protein
VKYLSSILFLTLLAATTLAQEHASPGQPKAATLMSGLGDLHHPVSTSNPQAQQFFRSGTTPHLRFQSRRSSTFVPAHHELDPKLAMAYWGIAEAVGTKL